MTLTTELPKRYGGGMTAKKFTISMPEDLHAELERTARNEETTVSAWVAEAVEVRLGRQRRLAAMDEAIAAYEAEHGAFTEEEIAVATAEREAAVARSKARYAEIVARRGDAHLL